LPFAANRAIASCFGGRRKVRTV